MPAVREFFELFKTPWEPAVPGRAYPVVLATGEAAPTGARLVLQFGGRVLPMDTRLGVPAIVCDGPRDIELAASRAVLYGRSCRFDPSRESAAATSEHGLSYITRLDGTVCERIGYDLFGEVSHLLARGQPVERAGLPALDLHIDHLRTRLRAHGLSFVEVPPHPAGYPFLCCLTHDIDFAGIRRHGFDRTVGGFIARGTVGSVRDVFTGRRTMAEAGRNMRSVASLPFVHCGASQDPWRPFEAYRHRDAPRRATYFVVPRRDHAGQSPDGKPRPTRAVRYEAADVSRELVTCTEAGHEVALHGLDAWQGHAQAMTERQRVESASQSPVSGVRRPWLYFDAGAPAHLDVAGFSYDSTCGYNATVGYRAGTAQAFTPPGCASLLELPLHVMDTALFYPDRLGLAQDEGVARCLPMVSRAAQEGGTVVVNWHDRSLVPERLWTRAYDALLSELDGHQPWYATARDAAAWFRKRRGVSFARRADDSISVDPGAGEDPVPGLLVAVDTPSGRASSDLTSAHGIGISLS